VIAWDLWQQYNTARPAPEVTAPHTPLTPDEWILGETCTRTWNPDPGNWTLTPTHEVYRLTGEHLRTNVLVVAPQGAGKSRSLLDPIIHWGRRQGAALFVFDSKGDDFAPPTLPAATFHLTFDLDNPASMRFNIISDPDPRRAGEQLGEALIPDTHSDKAYFGNNAKDALGGLFAAHHAVTGQMPTLRDVLLYLRDPDSRETLLWNLRQRPDTREAILDVQRIIQLAGEDNDALGSLDNALAPLARGAVAELLTTGGDGYSIPQLLAQGIRVRWVLRVDRDPRIAPILGRLILAQFTNTVISPTCNRAIWKICVVDEAKPFITPAIARGMALARANRGIYVLSFQTLSQISDPTLREDILSVSGNKIALAGVGDLDAKKFSDLFGSEEHLYITHSTTEGESTNRSSSSGRSHGGSPFFGSGNSPGPSNSSQQAQSNSSNTSAGITQRMQMRARFLASEIRGLPQFHVVIERRDGRGEVTPATVVALNRPLLERVLRFQSQAVYRLLGRTEGSCPVLPTLTPPLVPVHLPLRPAPPPKENDPPSSAAPKAKLPKSPPPPAGATAALPLDNGADAPDDRTPILVGANHPQEDTLPASPKRVPSTRTATRDSAPEMPSAPAQVYTPDPRIVQRLHAGKLPSGPSAPYNSLPAAAVAPPDACAEGTEAGP